MRGTACILMPKVSCVIHCYLSLYSLSWFVLFLNARKLVLTFRYVISGIEQERERITEQEAENEI